MTVQNRNINDVVRLLAIDQSTFLHKTVKRSINITWCVPAYSDIISLYGNLKCDTLNTPNPMCLRKQSLLVSDKTNPRNKLWV